MFKPAVFSRNIFWNLKSSCRCGAIKHITQKDEVAYHLKDSDAKMLFCFEGNNTLPMGKEGFKGFKKVDSCLEFITITADPKSTSNFKNSITLNKFIESEAGTFKTVETKAEDTAVIINTSGTTGRPKGAELSHANLFSNAEVCKGVFKMKDDDITLSVLPLFHILDKHIL